LGITLKTARFLAHRIREAMCDGELAVPFGHCVGSEQCDETYIEKWRRKGENERGTAHKMKVLKRG
jgi:hypothetical protein